MFLGHYICSMDANGRIALPSTFCSQILEPLVITRGLDGCLDVYLQSDWNIVCEQLRSLNTLVKQHRQLQRFYFSNAEECIVTNGCIQLPSRLLPIVGFDSIVAVGVGDKIELWNINVWQKYVSDDEMLY